MAKKLIQNLKKIQSTVSKDAKKLSSKNKEVSRYRFNIIRRQFLETVPYKEIFLEQLGIALSINPEFGVAEYLDPLYRVVDNPKLLIFDYENRTVRLNMVGTAGKLDNWAKAVSMARRESAGASPLKASFYWQMMYKAAREKWEYKEKQVEKKFKNFSIEQNKHYHTFKKDYTRREFVHKLSAKNRTKKLAQLYWNIIRTRIGSLKEGEAPWWYILNYGVSRTGMSSDKGGLPYPRAKSTRFVEKTENELTKLFKAMFKETAQDKSKKIVDTKALAKDIRQVFRAIPPDEITYVMRYRSTVSGRYVSATQAAEDPLTYEVMERESNQYIRQNY
jgi:hypothetical protein